MQSKTSEVVQCYMCERQKSTAAHCESCFAFPNEKDARSLQVIIAEFIEQNTAQLTHLLSSAESSRCLIIKLLAWREKNDSPYPGSTSYAHTQVVKDDGVDLITSAVDSKLTEIASYAAQKPINLNGRLTCRRVVIKSVKRSEVTCAGYWIKLTILSEKGLGVHLESTKLTSITPRLLQANK